MLVPNTVNIFRTIIIPFVFVNVFLFERWYVTIINFSFCLIFYRALRLVIFSTKSETIYFYCSTRKILSSCSFFWVLQENVPNLISHIICLCVCSMSSFLVFVWEVEKQFLVICKFNLSFIWMWDEKGKLYYKKIWRVLLGELGDFDCEHS